MPNKNYTAIDHLINKPVAGKPTKEREPLTLSMETPYLQEVVEHQAEKEVRPYISPRRETIELPPDVKKLGVQSTASAQFSTYQNVKLPISDDKIMAGLHAPITSSIRWLATLAIYVLRHAHLGLKVIHGKIVRVIRL